MTTDDDDKATLRTEMNEWRAEKVAKKLKIDELHKQNDELVEQHERERANEKKEDV